MVSKTYPEANGVFFFLFCFLHELLLSVLGARERSSRIEMRAGGSQDELLDSVMLLE